MPKLRPLWTPGGTRDSGSGTVAINETAGTVGIGFAIGARPDFVINWQRDGRLVALYLSTGGTYTGTSDTTGFSISGLPAEIRPSQVVTSMSFTGIDSGVGTISRCQITTAGVINFQRGSVSGTDVVFSTTGWTASGSKGLAGSWQLVYVLA